MDGIILINKEKEWTSHDVVAKVKKLLKVKVGHTGTLDPNATGVLPLLLGNATKISKYLINHDKEYIAELKLGIKTDTADGEGKIIAEKKVDIEQLLLNKISNSMDENCCKGQIYENCNNNEILNKKLQEVLNDFIGKSLQKPPMYSAIKVNGKKLYEYARNKQEIEVKPREIEIYKIELIEFNIKENIIKFKVSCSKGTYIRTLCENIAEKLDTYGYMKELQRTQVGEFNIKDAITISELEEKIKNNEEVNNSKNKYFISIEKMFSNYDKIELDKEKLYKFLNGVMINNNNFDGIYRIYNENKFIGLGINSDKKLKRDVII